MLEQTSAPAQVEDSLRAAEIEAHPEWEVHAIGGQSRQEFTMREQAEWESAELIFCGSDFVRRGIEECGGPVERCVVVPYGVGTDVAAPQAPRLNGRLRILICGRVSLMKGAFYALEAAAALRGIAEFRWVGQVCLLPSSTARLGEHIGLRGVIPRTAMPDQYAWADVFLLPTLCEGSATVCYEALAAGLPVITTPNAGSVVRDGLDGFIVPIRDPEAIAGKLQLLAHNRELLRWMSKNARRRAREFTVEKYGERLVMTLRPMMQGALR
jgi:glycosyltransferase involved in cell wall biosynthesis